jgi:hypothetical protein
MRKAYLVWLADYAGGIVGALALLLVVSLIVAWVDVFRSHPILGAACTILSAFIIAVLVRGVPYIRKRADDRRLREPDEESLSGMLRDLRQARTEREMREKLRGRRK